MRTGCAVTGGTGYVGSRIARALADDFDVTVMGRKVGRDGITWTMGEQVNAQELRARNIEVLVHAAWDMKQTDGAKNWQCNVNGTRLLIEAAKAGGVKVLIFVSTISAFDEARSDYGKSKLAAEKMVIEAGGTVVRPGLVWGDTPGGVFGAMRKQIARGGLVPMIGGGRYPQYLVHEDDLAEAVKNLAKGKFNGRVLTVAHPREWTLRNLTLGLADKEGVKIVLFSVPWQFVYGALRVSEALGLRLGFRSDSVISLVYRNRSPELSSEFPVRPFGFS